jgi:TP901 family phage tail tape measure protein
MDMKLFLQIVANASSLKREMGESKNSVTRFTQGARREIDALKGTMGSLKGQLAGLGFTIGTVQQLSQSAQLDKGLTQVRQTAGEGAEMVKGLRHEFFLMSRDTGAQVEGLKDGFDGLIQAGQSWKAALESTKGINIAKAVTGANEGVLAKGLTVGAEQFGLNLEGPGEALKTLDKMTIAGRLGSAELENLSDIFARVGGNAAAAQFGFDKTLAFIEALSAVEKQPERLATLADSTLRVFTNLNYMAAAQKGTGIKFFADDGSRRDPVAVLEDIKKRWDVLKNDKQRAVFIQKAFGKADLDTIKGIRTLLSGDSLGKVREFTQKIGSASGTL